MKLFGEGLVLDSVELFLRLCLLLLLFAFFLFFWLCLVHDNVAFCIHLLKKLVLIVQVFDLAEVDLGVVAFKVFAHDEVRLVVHGVLEVTEVHDLGSGSDAFGQHDLRLAFLARFHLQSLCVDVRQDISHLTEVAICDHPVSLVKH